MTLIKPVLVKNFGLAAIAMIVMGYLGSRLDAHENERMTKFRDKSALYGRVLKPGEAPSWP